MLAARPQRGHVTPLLAPAHVVEQTPVPPEGQHPPGADGGGHRTGDHCPSQASAPRRPAPSAHQQQGRSSPESEEGGEDVQQPGQSQQRSGQHPIAARAHALGRHADVCHRAGKAERVGELARHGRHQVAAVDVERAVEKEQNGGRSREGLARTCDTTHTGHSPDGGRKHHHAGDGHELERHPIGHGNSQQRHQRGRDGGREPDAGPGPQRDPYPSGRDRGQHQGREGAVDERLLVVDLPQRAETQHAAVEQRQNLKDGNGARGQDPGQQDPVPGSGRGPRSPECRNADEPDPRTGRGKVGEETRGQPDPRVDDHDEQGRQHHVERERGEARVPVMGPAGEPQLAQKHIPQIGPAPTRGRPGHRRWGWCR